MTPDGGAGLLPKQSAKLGTVSEAKQPHDGATLLWSKPLDKR